MLPIKKFKLGLSSTVLLFLVACGDKSADEFLAEGQKAAASKDYQQAIVHFKNAVVKAPQNVKIREILGNTYLYQGSYVSAEKELSRALELGSSSPQLAMELAYAYAKTGDLVGLDELIAQSGSLPDEYYSSILFFAGLAAFTDKDLSKAEDFFNQSISIGQTTVTPLSQAYLSFIKQDFSRALAQVNEANIDGILSYESLLLKGNTLFALEDYLAATEAYQTRYKAVPKDHSVLYLIANSLIHNEQYEQAEKNVDLLLSVSESSPLANQYKSQLMFQRKDYREAINYAEKSLSSGIELHVPRIVAGISAYNLGEYESAYNYLVKMKDLLPSDHIVKRLIAELQWRLGYEADAVNTYQQLAEVGNVDSSMLIAVSQELIKKGKQDTGKNLLDAAILLNSEDFSDLQQQALTKFSLDEIEAGIKLLEQSLALNPSAIEVETQLANAYLSNTQITKAQNIANKWEQEEQYRIKGLLFSARIQQTLEQHDNAKKILTQVLKESPNNVLAMYLLAVYANAEENFRQAFEYYSKIISANPNFSPGMKAILAFVNKNKEFQTEFEKFYKAEIAKKPDAQGLKIGLSYFYSTEKRFDEALTLLEAIKTSAKPAEGVDLLIGDIFAAKGDNKSAIVYYESVLKSNPDSVLAHSKLVTMFEREKNIDNALTQVNNALQYHPDHIGFKLFKANYMSRLNRVPPNSLLSELQESSIAKEHWLLASTLGNLAFSKNDMEAASRYYRKAYGDNRSDYSVIQLSRSVARTEGVSASIDVLKAHLNRVGSSAPVLAMLANAYMYESKYELAERVYLDILELEPEQLLSLNNLAFIHVERNDKNQAIHYAERAFKKAPNNPSILDTYGQALLLNNKAEQALVSFEKALSINGENNDFSLHKAKALVVLNRKEEAQQIIDGLDNLNDIEKEQITQMGLNW
ncbi:PEP-CTERM system TPR-repeat protein PrsT [Endozoicomonas sp. G2_1]|uniref:XrtA/PEP-CTERM system TPR-repeat protein PrsT n=1 Tax=Endozoicomonas sp. G2_1 TaxID=2821091 RepID=UPI001ADB5F7B|nr:PEP-CTERM system TPR-repeat protein PrsT [Endozoicomonas sp. G2_1]